MRDEHRENPLQRKRPLRLKLMQAILITLLALLIVSIVLHFSIFAISVIAILFLTASLLYFYSAKTMALAPSPPIPVFELFPIDENALMRGYHSLTPQIRNFLNTQPGPENYENYAQMVYACRKDLLKVRGDETFINSIRTYFYTAASQNEKIAGYLLTSDTLRRLMIGENVGSVISKDVLYTRFCEQYRELIEKNEDLNLLGDIQRPILLLYKEEQTKIFPAINFLKTFSSSGKKLKNSDDCTEEDYTRYLENAKIAYHYYEAIINKNILHNGTFASPNLAMFVLTSPTLCSLLTDSEIQRTYTYHNFHENYILARSTEIPIPLKLKEKIISLSDPVVQKLQGINFTQMLRKDLEQEPKTVEDAETYCYLTLNAAAAEEEKSINPDYLFKAITLAAQKKETTETQTLRDELSFILPLLKWKRLLDLLGDSNLREIIKIEAIKTHLNSGFCLVDGLVYLASLLLPPSSTKEVVSPEMRVQAHGGDIDELQGSKTSTEELDKVIERQNKERDELKKSIALIKQKRKIEDKPSLLEEAEEKKKEPPFSLIEGSVDEFSGTSGEQSIPTWLVTEEEIEKNPLECVLKRAEQILQHLVAHLKTLKVSGKLNPSEQKTIRQEHFRVLFCKYVLPNAHSDKRAELSSTDMNNVFGVIWGIYKEIDNLLKVSHAEISILLDVLDSSLIKLQHPLTLILAGKCSEEDIEQHLMQKIDKELQAYNAKLKETTGLYRELKKSIDRRIEISESRSQMARNHMEEIRAIYKASSKASSEDRETHLGELRAIYKAGSEASSKDRETHLGELREIYKAGSEASSKDRETHLGELREIYKASSKELEEMGETFRKEQASQFAQVQQQLSVQMQQQFEEARQQLGEMKQKFLERNMLETTAEVGIALAEASSKLGIFSVPPLASSVTTQPSTEGEIPVVPLETPILPSKTPVMHFPKEGDK